MAIVDNQQADSIHGQEIRGDAKGFDDLEEGAEGPKEERRTGHRDQAGAIQDQHQGRERHV